MSHGISDSERNSGVLSSDTLAAIVRDIDTVGFAVVENLISQATSDLLSEAVLEDVERIRPPDDQPSTRRTRPKAISNLDSGANAIMRTIERVSGLEASVCHVLSKTLVDFDPSWEGPLLGDKSNSMIFDTAKIEGLAGDWRCEVSLEKGIRRTWLLVTARVEAGFRPNETIDALVDRFVKDHFGAG